MANKIGTHLPSVKIGNIEYTNATLITRLECVNDSHNKYYEIWFALNPGLAVVVLTRHGRMGAVGRWSLHSTNIDIKFAENSITTLRQDKIKKGYIVIVDVTDYVSFNDKIKDSKIVHIQNNNRLALIEFD